MGATALVENPFMEPSLQMKTLSTSMTWRGYSAWPMLDQTQMAASSSLQSCPAHGWMASILSLARSLMGLRSLRRWKPMAPPVGLPWTRLSFLTVASFEHDARMGGYLPMTGVVAWSPKRN